MKIEKHYKNNGVVKKELFEIVKRMKDRKIIVVNYTWFDSLDKTVNTELEIQIHEENEYIDSLHIISIEDEDNDQEEYLNHWELLKADKKKLYTYLSKHFEGVEMQEDFYV